MKQRKGLLLAAAGLAVAALTVFLLRAGSQKEVTAMGFAMDTVITQTAYGSSAQQGIQAVNRALAALEGRLSLYRQDSEVAAVNAAAGSEPVAVSDETLALLQQALDLDAKTEGCFQLTIAPLTRLWGITSEHPQVPAQGDIDALLPLVDDSTLAIDAAAGTVFLPTAGQALDLGGVAKGYACNVARQVYAENGVRHALLSIGGNICALGGRPDGQPFRIGFRDPEGGEASYIASFLLRDGVVAVSGGYERYFEADGVRYHHILDPHTGRPAQSDILSVGVVCPDGTAADLWSTALFCMGRDRALAWMRNTDAGVLLLDETGTLYVSESLREGFHAEKGMDTVVFVGA